MQGGGCFSPCCHAEGDLPYLLYVLQNNLVVVLYLVSCAGCSNISLLVRIRSQKSDEGCHQETVPVNIYHRHLAVSLVPKILSHPYFIASTPTNTMCNPVYKTKPFAQIKNEDKRDLQYWYNSRSQWIDLAAKRHRLNYQTKRTSWKVLSGRYQKYTSCHLRYPPN